MGSVILSVFETLVVAFTIWGLFNEDKFVSFEEKLFAKIKFRKRKFKVIHGGLDSNEHCA